MLNPGTIKVKPPASRYRPMKRAGALAHLLVVLALVLPALAVLPSAAAHHPGSVMGLARYEAYYGPLGSKNIVHRNPDVDATLARWESTYPEFVSRSTIGKTTAGFDIYNVLVTDESVPFDGAALSTGKKLRVYLDGGHHGNEYMGVELVMYWLEELLAKAGAGDAETLQFLRDVEVHATPIVNVEGNLLDTRKNGRQVDPNRNYPFEWGGPGSGATVNSFTYRGPSPASEPEVQANIAFAESISPDVWVTMHTGVAEFYWPWGWTHDPSPDDEFFTSLEAPFEEATNGRVDAMQAAELYLAAGATDDFGYGAMGVPTFTYEVHEDQFIPVYGQPIPDVIRDQLNGLEWVVRNVRHMGAWVEPTLTAEGLRLENQGWGKAVNVTVELKGRAVVVPEIPRGGAVTVPATSDEAEGATVTYPVLLINTSRVRTHYVDTAIAHTQANEKPVPALGLAGLLAAAGVAAAALVARRRLR